MITKLLNKRKPIFDFRGILSWFWELQPALFGTKLFRDQFGVHYQKYGQNKAIMPVYRKR